MTPTNRAQPMQPTSLGQWGGIVGGSILMLYALGRRSSKLFGLGFSLLAGSWFYPRLTAGRPLSEVLGWYSAKGKRPAVSVAYHRGVKLEEAVTINRSPEELYQFWRNFENLPRFMHHVKSVQNLGDGRSHWVVEGPVGMTVEWDAEIVNEVENEVIGWRSLPNAIVDHAGSVHFNQLPAGRGTEVKVVLKYDPPGGQIGHWAAKFLGEDPQKQIKEDLSHFKQLLEAGEVPVAESQPAPALRKSKSAHRKSKKQAEPISRIA